MSSIHLVFGDAHAHPDHSNARADLLGNLLIDLKPDVVIDIGDTADMPSLSTYDKGKRDFVGRSYERDIASHNEFQDRVWHRYRRSKKKLPRRVRLIGNHEQRIDRALDLHPELAGAISYNHLEIERYYDDIIYYDGQTPGSISIDGVIYSHYFVSGLMGRPLSGEHTAYSLLGKNYQSSTQGHSHIFDSCVRTTAEGRRLQGLVSGCFQDYDADWAGQSNRLWWRGCFIKKNVDAGSYDLEAVSLERLRKEYDT